MKKLIYLIILLSIFTLHCNKEDKNSENPTSKLEESELQFENVNLVKSYKDCLPTAGNCTYILFDYKKVSDGLYKDDINNTINEELIKISKEYLSSKEAKSLDEICQDFLKEYKDFIFKNPKVDIFWMMEVRGKIENYTPKILCYSISAVNFMGGAHPNTQFRYINFDRKTGKLLTLKDIFTVGFESKLNAILDKLIRKIYFLKPDDNLSEKIGLFENKIEFNNNFAITKHGIKFYYNPYEIAPYSVGFIEITIPYSELEEILPLNSKARP